MKNVKSTIYLLVFIFSTTIIAQKDTIWYDANWNITIKNQASYFRTPSIKKGNGYVIIDYFLSGAKQMEAFSLTNDEDHFDGIVTWYYENGKVMQTVNYKNGVLNGERKNYYINGILKDQFSYKDAKITGKWVSYYENTKISETGSYENGDRNGFWKEYYKNGKLKGEGKYANDKKVGVWKMYYYNGAENQENP